MHDARKDQRLTRLGASGIDHQVWETIQVDIRDSDSFAKTRSWPREGEMVRLRCGVWKNVNQAVRTRAVGSDCQVVACTAANVPDRNCPAINSPAKIRCLAAGRVLDFLPERDRTACVLEDEDGGYYSLLAAGDCADRNLVLTVTVQIAQGYRPCPGRWRAGRRRNFVRGIARGVGRRSTYSADEQISNSIRGASQGEIGYAVAVDVPCRSVPRLNSSQYLQRVLPGRAGHRVGGLELPCHGIQEENVRSRNGAVLTSRRNERHECVDDTILIQIQGSDSDRVTQDQRGDQRRSVRLNRIEYGGLGESARRARGRATDRCSCRSHRERIRALARAAVGIGDDNVKAAGYRAASHGDIRR